MIFCIVVTISYFIVPHEIGIFSLRELELLLVYSFWMMFAIGTKNVLFCNRVTKFISSISMEIYLSHMMFYRVIEKTGLIKYLGSGICSYLIINGVLIVTLLVCIPVIKEMIRITQGHKEVISRIK